MNKIAIIGSTGMLGQPVPRAFINAGFEVTVLARNAAKAAELYGGKARIIIGDLKHTESVRELLGRQDAVYLNLSVDPSSREMDFQPERDGLKHILPLAKELKIKRIGYLSSLVQFYTGIDWWVLNLKRDAIKQIKHSGLVYSIFYPSTFMESFDKGAYRQGNIISLAGESKFPMYLIAGSDYAAQVVMEFRKNNGNNEYIIQGQDGYIADHAARLFVANYKKGRIRIMKIPFGLLRFLGTISPKFNYGANIVHVLNNYPEKFESEKTWQDLGKPPTRFLDYIKAAK